MQFQLRTAVHHKFITKELCGIILVKIRPKERVAAFILQAARCLSRFIRFLFRTVHFLDQCCKNKEDTDRDMGVVCIEERMSTLKNANN